MVRWMTHYKGGHRYFPCKQTVQVVTRVQTGCLNKSGSPFLTEGKIVFVKYTMCREKYLFIVYDGKKLLFSMVCCNQFSTYPHHRSPLYFKKWKTQVLVKLVSSEQNLYYVLMRTFKKTEIFLLRFFELTFTLALLQ